MHSARQRSQRCFRHCSKASFSRMGTWYSIAKSGLRAEFSPHAGRFFILEEKRARFPVQARKKTGEGTAGFCRALTAAQTRTFSRPLTAARPRALGNKRERKQRVCVGHSQQLDDDRVAHQHTARGQAQNIPVKLRVVLAHELLHEAQLVFTEAQLKPIV